MAATTHHTGLTVNSLYPCHIESSPHVSMETCGGDPLVIRNTIEKYQRLSEPRGSSLLLLELCSELTYILNGIDRNSYDRNEF